MACASDIIMALGKKQRQDDLILASSRKQQQDALQPELRIYSI